MPVNNSSDILNHFQALTARSVTTITTCVPRTIPSSKRLFTTNTPLIRKLTALAKDAKRKWRLELQTAQGVWGASTRLDRDDPHFRERVFERSKNFSASHRAVEARLQAATKHEVNQKWRSALDSRINSSLTPFGAFRHSKSKDRVSAPRQIPQLVLEEIHGTTTIVKAVYTSNREKVEGLVEQ